MFEGVDTLFFADAHVGRGEPCLLWRGQGQPYLLTIFAKAKSTVSLVKGYSSLGGGGGGQ